MEGSALLQGLLLCGNCGRYLTVHYRPNKYKDRLCPTYDCSLKRREGVSTNSCCVYSQGDIMDNAVVQRALEVVQPPQIEIAIKAFEELERQNKAIERQWQMKIERAEYESQLAQRRYEEVDPSNRLVAANLEKNWEMHLASLEEIRKQYLDYQTSNNLEVSSQMKDQIISLATSLPKLWHAPTTTFKDQKRILRFLIKDVTFKKSADKKEIILHIRWQGGACEDLRLETPMRTCDKWCHSPELIERVRILAKDKTDGQIVDIFNKKGLRTNKCSTFTVNIIRWIRNRNNISPAQFQRVGELSTKQVADKFGVRDSVVRYWVERGILQTRKLPGQGTKLWIFIDEEKEQELKKRVENSPRNILKQN